MLASTIQESRNKSPTSPHPDITSEPASDASDTQQHAMHPSRNRGKIRMRSLASTSEHPQPARNSRPRSRGVLLRKEVIQPHLPVRLPCYDFVPIASPTFDGSPHKG